MKITIDTDWFEFLEEEDAAVRQAAYNATLLYMLTGEEPNAEGILRLIWKVIKPKVDKASDLSLKRRTAGATRKEKENTPPEDTPPTNLFPEEEIKVPKPKPPKHEYEPGVRLTKKERDELVKRYSEEDVKQMLKWFSLYKQDKNYKNKSDYAALLRWAARAYIEDKARGRWETTQPTQKESQRLSIETLI